MSQTFKKMLVKYCIANENKTHNYVSHFPADNPSPLLRPIAVYVPVWGVLGVFISPKSRKNDFWQIIMSSYSGCFVKLIFSAEFRSVPFRSSELALPRKLECLGMSTFFRGITETITSLFRGIFSERNSVPNPTRWWFLAPCWRFPSPLWQSWLFVPSYLLLFLHFPPDLLHLVKGIVSRDRYFSISQKCVDFLFLRQSCIIFINFDPETSTESCLVLWNHRQKAAFDMCCTF